MNKYAFIGGQYLDPILNSKQNMNILIDNKKIIGLGYLPDEDEKDSKIIEINNCLIIPNVIDMFANFGSPSYTSFETLESSSMAALAGGITMACFSPNIEPIPDSPEMVTHIKERSHNLSKIPLFPLGTITKKRQGNEIAEYGLMKAHGAIGFTDGKTIDKASVMKLALQYSSMIDMPLIIGPTMKPILDGRIMHEGYYSTILGIKGLSPTYEENAIHRDLTLLAQYGGKIHFSHVSTKGGVDLIRRAKQKGLKVTCGTAPHYLYLSDEDVDGFNTLAKVNPPFRPKEHIKALIAGLKDGTIDVLQSHHIALPFEDKHTDFATAKFGISGLDLFLPLIITKLYYEEDMSLEDIIAKISINPAKILNLKLPGLSVGNTTSFTVIDLKKEFTVKAEILKSQGKNTPFLGKQLKGVVKYGIINGEIIYSLI